MTTWRDLYKNPTYALVLLAVLAAIYLPDHRLVAIAFLVGAGLADLDHLVSHLLRNKE